MRTLERSGTFLLGDKRVGRLGYGAMHLSGPGIFGPPREREPALAVLREAVASGMNHIDTSDVYGPHVTNQLIRDALRLADEGLAHLSGNEHQDRGECVCDLESHAQPLDGGDGHRRHGGRMGFRGARECRERD